MTELESKAKGGFVAFEHDYRQKIMVQTFQPGHRITDTAQIQAWRSQWMRELSGWHSPYKLLILGQGLTVELEKEGWQALKRMFDFFAAAHLKKAVATDITAIEGSSDFELPFVVAADLTTAEAAIGMRGARSETAAGDFRSQIHIESHFRQQVIEITFEDNVLFDSTEKLDTLRSKLTNQLMQWHSPWSLLIDCSKADIKTEFVETFQRHLKAFSGFFLKKTIGYGAKAEDRQWPFPVYRARHRAAAEVEKEGLFDAGVANCATRK